MQAAKLSLNAETAEARSSVIIQATLSSSSTNLRSNLLPGSERRPLQNMLTWLAWHLARTRTRRSGLTDKMPSCSKTFRYLFTFILTVNADIAESRTFTYANLCPILMHRKCNSPSQAEIDIEARNCRPWITADILRAQEAVFLTGTMHETTGMALLDVSGFWQPLGQQTCYRCSNDSDCSDCNLDMSLQNHEDGCHRFMQRRLQSPEKRSTHSLFTSQGE
jgi:hypothetical protein